MAVAVHVDVSARFEVFLRLAANSGETASGETDSGEPGVWLQAAALAGEIDAGVRAEDLPGALLAQSEALGIDATRVMAGLRACMPGFLAMWRSRSAEYQAAADRLSARLAEAPGDLGALFGFPIELDPRRRGLRSNADSMGPGPFRLAPNRLSAIHLLPSAFNLRHFWHLGAATGGRHAVYLPCHDPVLAAQVADRHHDAAPGSRRSRLGHGDAGQIFAALGDSSRFAMAQILARETVTAATLGRRLDLSPPAISYHLGELRKAGLVNEYRLGASLQLSLRRDAFTDLGARMLASLEAARPLPSPRSRRKAH